MLEKKPTEEIERKGLEVDGDQEVWWPQEEGISAGDRDKRGKCSRELRKHEEKKKLFQGLSKWEVPDLVEEAWFRVGDRSQTTV